MSSFAAPVFPTFVARKLSARLIALNRSTKSALMLAADCLALPLCFQLALQLHVPDALASWRSLAATLATTVLLTMLSIAALTMADLYDAAVRYLDQRRLALAGLGLGAAVLCVYLLNLDRPQLPNLFSKLMIYWLLAFAYLAGSRLAVRGFLHSHTRTPLRARDAVAIYGAGETGAQLAQAMRGDSQYCPVCYFDQKHSLTRSSIAGLRVFPPERLAEIVAASSIRLIVIALPATSSERLGAILRMVRAAGVSIKFLHGMLDLADHAVLRAAADGRAAHARQRGRLPFARVDIAPEQLLGRAPVQPDHALFGRCVRGKSVLVTGAGGSIGSELCRQIAGLGPRRLHLLDHSEFALYTIRQELLNGWPELPLRAHLGSVCSEQLLERIMQEDSIDTIYHAAAYKHVPMVETNLVEGLRNNVLGARAVASAARKFLVETCVLISSDKAVRPSTIMGASKRISELLFQAAALAGSSTTTYCMVRFGNVLGSSGSVVPLFRRQLQQGGPLTVTDPDVERYFMLIPEAAQLVIQAGAMAEGGDVFVLDMGQAIRIADLARSMITLAGLTEKTEQYPQGEIEIQYIGLFPGEKLKEELLTADAAVPSSHPRILRMKEQALAPALLDQYIALLLTACDTNDRWLIESMLKTIMTEFTPQTRLHADDAAVAMHAIAQLAAQPAQVQQF